MTFAVLGDGRSGVELAATLADLLPDWYAQISGNKQEIRVVILQRGKEILKGDRDKLRSSLPIEPYNSMSYPWNCC